MSIPKITPIEVTLTIEKVLQFLTAFEQNFQNQSPQYFARKNQSEMLIYLFAKPYNVIAIDESKNLSFSAENVYPEYPLLNGALGLLYYDNCIDHKNGSITQYMYQVIIDTLRSRILVVDNGSENNLASLISSLLQAKIRYQEMELCVDEFKTDISDDTFQAKISSLQSDIKQGEVFQAVLSRKFIANYEGHPMRLFLQLLVEEAMPFYFMISDKEGVYIAASPEAQLICHERHLMIHPLAGTRKNTTKGRKSLLTDPKEKREHMMLVDLARNDLGRVAQVGSVFVSELCNVREFGHVVHLSSTVVADLESQYTAMDALLASFPAGTLSGAPKKRAMELIQHYETSKRQLYGGTVFLIGANDELESCIAIRMAFFRNNTVEVRAGAGIVYDSNPTGEALETRHKAFMLMAHLQRCNGGAYVSAH